MRVWVDDVRGLLGLIDMDVVESTVKNPDRGIFRWPERLGWFERVPR